MTPCELIAHRARIRCARNDPDVLPDHVIESKKVLAGLDQYTGAICEHHAGKVHNLHARQRNCSRSALHVGGVVNNRIESSALVYRHPFYRERHVQLRFKRSCNEFAKLDCVTDWPSLSVYVRERPRICPIGNSKRCSLVNGPQAAVTWLGKGKASGQGEASERRNCRPHHCTSARLSAPFRPLIKMLSEAALRNAAMRACPSMAAAALMSTPMRRIRSGCCARARL